MFEDAFSPSITKVVIFGLLVISLAYLITTIPRTADDRIHVSLDFTATLKCSGTPTIYTYDTEKDLIGRIVTQSGGFESDLVEYMEQVLKIFAPCSSKQDKCTPPLMLDVGANVGIYSLCAAGQQKVVVSVEAMPTTAKLLRTSIHKNHLQDKVTVHNVALDAPNHPAIACMKPDLSNMGATQVTYNGSSTAAEKKASNFVHCTPVPIKTLDSLNINGSAIAFFKLDVEGFEGQVLLGGKRLFAVTPPCFGLIELSLDSFNPIASHGHMTAVKELIRHGYYILRPGKQHGSIKLLDVLFSQLFQGIPVKESSGWNSQYNAKLEDNLNTLAKTFAVPEVDIAHWVAKWEQVNAIFVHSQLARCLTRVQKHYCACA